MVRSNDNPAVSILGMQHLAAMGKWLIPQETKALLARCVVKELPGSMTEAEMYAQRTAAATARGNKDKVITASCLGLPQARNRSMICWNITTSKCVPMILAHSNCYCTPFIQVQSGDSSYVTSM